MPRHRDSCIVSLDRVERASVKALSTSGHRVAKRSVMMVVIASQMLAGCTLPSSGPSLSQVTTGRVDTTGPTPVDRYAIVDIDRQEGDVGGPARRQ